MREINKVLFFLACSYQATLLDKLSFTVPCGFGYKIVKIFRLPLIYKGEAFGYVIENKDRIVLVFKGTSLNLFDLSVDLDIFQVKYPFVKDAGKTHKGFTYLYSLLREKVLDTLENCFSAKALYITGHSLGGALATIAALDIAVNTSFKNPHIYTSGSPRVGNKTFADKFDAVINDSIRTVNIKDYITIEPQTSPFKGIFYKHVKGENPFSFQCNKPNSSPFKFTILENHLSINYFNFLRQKAKSFVEEMCTRNPKFCPPKTPLCKASI